MRVFVAGSTGAIGRHLIPVPGAVPEGIVLWYGLFYGHGAANGTLAALRAGKFPLIGGGTGIWSFCEITDAATATAAAVTRGAPGIYNIVDDEPAPAAQWVPFLAQCLGVEAPAEMSAEQGRELAGDYLTAQMTVGRGSSNAKAKRELGWTPRYATWREGFPECPAASSVKWCPRPPEAPLSRIVRLGSGPVTRSR